MGFFKNIIKAAPMIGAVSAISKPLGSIGLLNTAISGSPGGESSNEDQYRVQMPPQIDPRLGQMRDKQQQLAQDFQAQTPGLMSRSMTQAEDDTKMDLNQKRMDIAKGANARGLLYSGLKTDAENQAGAEAGGSLAKRRRGIADSFEQQQQQLDKQAFDTGSTMQGLEQARYDNIYKAQLVQQQRQAQDQTSPLGILGAPFRALGF